MYGIQVVRTHPASAAAPSCTTSRGISSSRVTSSPAASTSGRYAGSAGISHGNRNPANAAAQAGRADTSSAVAASCAMLPAPGNVTATRPPGTSARRIPISASTCLSTTQCSAVNDTTRSNAASNGSSRASATTNVHSGCSRRASSIISADRSHPVTDADSISAVTLPSPQPTSSTRAPGGIAIRRMKSRASCSCMLEFAR